MSEGHDELQKGEPAEATPSTPPLTVQAWLAAAPKPEEADLEAGEHLRVEPAATAEPFSLQPIAQPVDVVPITGISPVAEQSHAEETLPIEGLVPTEDEPSFDSGAAHELLPVVDESTFNATSIEPIELEPFDQSSPLETPASVEMMEPYEPITADEATEGPPCFAPVDSTAAPELHESLPLEVKSTVVAVEPSPAELSMMPAETHVASTVAAAALVSSASAPETVSEPTAAETFQVVDHAVAAREARPSGGYVTKTAGVIGLLGCVAGLGVFLAACAGVNRIALFDNLPLLDLGFWILAAGGGGIALALLGGLIEHRRMHEETHVLGALFSNVLAAVGGTMLWLAATHSPLIK